MSVLVSELSLSRQNEDGSKLLSISGENKENFITEEKSKQTSGIMFYDLTLE